MSTTQLSDLLPATILVVDDALETRKILTQLLDMEGFDTLQAENGLQALDLIADQPPDLVILDVMMPEMDGLATLKHIREQYAPTAMPVIMVTALGSAHDMVEGLELGANDYLTKPPQFEILAARVRTQLRNRRLEDQRARDMKQLHELNGMKDKFLQIAAHDLRNPLHNLVIGLEILRRNAESRGTQEDLGILTNMEMSASVMKAMISDFLDLGALQAGRFELDPVNVDLNTIVETVVTQYSTQAEQKGVALSAEYGEGLPLVRGDKDRLVQVTANLVSNAVKFSPVDAGDVRVRTRLDEGRVLVEVADNGPGIADDEQQLLFQEFARLTNQPTGGEKSSGVGLWIARQMVDMHGGDIGVRSKVGVGSLFWFSLPVG